MENFRYVKIVKAFIFIGIFFLFPLVSFAYSDKTTHPALTNEIVKFFNIHYPDLEIDDKERELIVQGSIDEDSFGRWMRHYYDPVYNRGITVAKKWQSSKEWSQDSKAQAGMVDSAFAGSLKSYYGHKGDYSWERAIYEYTWGDKDYGLSALGHILHFIEDATVPPHTRNDVHLVYLDEVFHDRSPYEHWASKFNIENIDVISTLGDKKPIELTTLDEYFDTVASHTNKNFFSKDTIFDEEYTEPVVDFYTIEKLSNSLTTSFGYRKMNGRSYKIVRLDKEFEWKKVAKDSSNGNYFIIDDDDLILTDYWNILSKQAVLNGAGVVKLFFDEVKKERETKTLAMKNRSWFKRVYDSTAGKVFNTSKAIYGSSVSYEDLQGSVIAAQEVVENEVVPEPEPEVVVEVKEEVVIPESEVVEEVTEEEVVEEVILGAGEVIDNPVAEEVVVKEVVEEVVATEAPVNNNSIGIIEVDRPFEGGGGGGIATVTEVAVVVVPPDSPTITSPASSGLYFATSTITFSGTASSTLIISNDYSNATTTADGSDEWELTLSGFSQGTTTIQFTAIDSDNVDSTATEIAVVVDTTVPTISSLTILECDNSLRTSACLSGGDTLNLSWTSTSTDIAYYGVIKDGVSIATTTATTSSQTLSNGTYSMEVVAYDNADNVATSSSQSVEISTMPIVINEIAWSGTASSSEDEWIELYNRTSYTIDLSDVVLVADDGVPYINLTNTIAANSYYLIERTDDNATSVTADLSVVFSGVGAGSGLSNTVEQLSLVHALGGQASTTLDSTPTTSSCSSAWCGGSDSSDYKSMERISVSTAGTTSSNWSSNNTYTKNGTDVGGNAINCTPKAQNSVSLESIGYYCSEETSSYLSGGYYTPGAGCIYLSPTLSGNKYGDIYRGTIASSTIVNGHSIGSNATSTEQIDTLSSPIQGEDYFVAIYPAADLTAFRSYFQTGGATPPHLNYGILEWKYGTAP
ncbi:MAG: lamin tail domain-containing protein [Parcubacteria group bacterium]|nr:lamin tail domain-containing protein [Parcubacteria group bacterium]